MSNPEYFTVKEASDITELSIHTLRYYEKVGLLGSIQRNSSGRRVYCQDDLDWIGFIKCLKSTGMSLDEIKRYAFHEKSGDENYSLRLDVLFKQKKRN